MVIKSYNVTLEEKTVDKVKAILKGQKLSPLLNSFLEEWIEKKEREKDFK
jgi:hypothetical protein